MDSSSGSPLRLPAGLHYECLKCGRGCEDFDEIRVDAAAVARLETLPVAELMSGGAVSPYRPNPWRPGEFILQKVAGPSPTGACCFLAETKLCRLHAAHGIEAKPAACRSFPFAFVETPSGTFVALSFACTAVLRRHGAPVSGQEEGLRRTLTDSPARRRLDENELALCEGVPLSWEQYERIEADCAELLAATPTAGAGLLAQAAYLRMLATFLRQAAGAQGGEASAGEAEERTAALELFRRRMAGDGSGRRWDRLLTLAERPRTSPALARLTLGYVLAFRAATERGGGRLATAARVTWGYVAWAGGWGRLRLPRLPGPVPWRALSRVHLNLKEPSQERLLRDYLAHCLFRKDLPARGEVLLGHNFLLLAYGFARVYAAAQAAAAGRAEATLEDLEEAIRAVEARHGLHSRFARLFGEHPWLRAMMQSLFDRAQYPYAMVNG